MIATLLGLLLAAQTPGTAVRLHQWQGRGDVTVSVVAVSPGVVPWRDAAGRVHHDVTVTYAYPDRSRFVTTLGWFRQHQATVPFHDAVPFAGVAVNAGPPRPPRSNQEIKDGVNRPSDVFLLLPEFDPQYRVPH